MWGFNASTKIPWKGGIKAPPKIIMINNDEPWLVYFPKPLMAKAKIQGHITEQNKPPLIKEYSAKLPVLTKPIIIMAQAVKLNIIKVRAGLSPEKIKIAVAIKM